MSSLNRLCLAFALLVFAGMITGCGRKAKPTASQSPEAAQNPATTSPEATVSGPAAKSLATPVETKSDLESALSAARAASKTQNYSNVVQHFDALRSSGRLTGDQLTQIQDAEARMMRELAGRAAGGDQNAMRQFRDLADRPRSSH
jgi:hypothetical protein